MNKSLLLLSIPLLILALVGSILISTYIYERYAAAHDFDDLPPPGQLIDIGGFKLHLYCTGSSANSPTVIVDAGLGDFSLGWQLIQPEVAKFARICTYDRAGYGWSEPSLNSRSLKNIAIELNTLLEKANVEGPYILVGHSFGGLTVQMFRELNPTKVVGAVFVDSVHKNQFNRLAFFQELYEKLYKQTQIRHFLIKTGLIRLYYEKIAPNSSFPPTFSTFPEALIKGYFRLNTRENTVSASLDEYLILKNSKTELKDAKGFDNLPIKVLVQEKNLFQDHGPAFDLTPEKAETLQASWYELQGEIKALSNQSELVIAEGSGHAITLERPDLVVEAIQQVVNEVNAQSRSNTEKESAHQPSQNQIKPSPTDGI